MNIFYLDPDPRICAEMHVDKHVVKMIIEYTNSCLRHIGLLTAKNILI